MGFGPQVVDLDGNGRRDVLSGSWPGELYCFSEQEDGSFSKRKLTHADGSDINTGKASTVFAADWDRDGDLDLITGEIGGKVFLIPNEAPTGEAAAAAYGAAVQLQAGGQPLKPGHHSGPIVADWDGDGRHDLIVGCGDGSVKLYRTTNDEGLPVLGAGRDLVAAGSGPGSRVKICVADWNGDGRLDLLAGDFASEPKPAPQLTPAEEKEKAELQARQAELSGAYRKMYDALLARAKAEHGIDFNAPDLTPEQRLAWATTLREMMAGDAEYAAMQRQMSELGQKLRKWMPGREYRGWVWLFLRRASAAETETTPDSGSPQDSTPGQRD